VLTTKVMYGTDVGKQTNFGWTDQVFK